MNIRTIIFTIIIFGSTINIAVAEVGSNSPTTYISYVDEGLGFYKVRNLDTPPRQFTYEDHTLNINQGDTVIWQNDADKTSFTILSDQNLWDSNVGYLRVGSKINYIFDNSGKYTFYIKEYPSRRQTIIVSTTDEQHSPSTWPTEATPAGTVVTTYSIATPEPTNTINRPINIPTYVPTVVPSKVGPNIPDINLNMSGTRIASIIVAIVSMLIIFRVGRNK